MPTKSLLDFADHNQTTCPHCHGITNITVTTKDGKTSQLPIVEWIDFGIALDAGCICF